jgi:hypothetical protein
MDPWQMVLSGGQLMNPPTSMVPRPPLIIDIPGPDLLQEQLRGPASRPLLQGPAAQRGPWRAGWMLPAMAALEGLGHNNPLGDAEYGSQPYSSPASEMGVMSMNRPRPVDGNWVSDQDWGPSPAPQSLAARNPDLAALIGNQPSETREDMLARFNRIGSMIQPRYGYNENAKPATQEMPGTFPTYQRSQLGDAPPTPGDVDFGQPSPDILAAIDRSKLADDLLRRGPLGRDYGSVQDQATAFPSVTPGYSQGFNRQPEPARVSESARTLGRGDVQGDRNERSRRVAAAGGWGPGPSGEQPNQVNPLMKEDKDALLSRIKAINPDGDLLNDRLRRSEPGAASQYMEQAQALSALEGKMNERERQKLIADLRGDTTIRPAGASPTGRDEAKFQEYKDNYYRNRNEAQGRTATFNVMRNLQRRGLPPSQALVIAANMFPTTGSVDISPNYQPTIQGNLSDLAKQAGENMLDPQARQRKFDAEQKDKDRANVMGIETLRAEAEKARATEGADRGRLNSLLVYSQGLQEQLKDPNLPIARRNELQQEIATVSQQIKPLLGGQQVAPAVAAPSTTAPLTLNPDKPASQQPPEYNAAMELRRMQDPMHLSEASNGVLDKLYGSAPEVDKWGPDSSAEWKDADYDKVADYMARGLGDPEAKPKIVQWLKHKRSQRLLSGGNPDVSTRFDASSPNPFDVIAPELSIPIRAISRGIKNIVNGAK